MGVAKERLKETRDRLRRGEHLLMLFAAFDESGHWRNLLTASETEPAWVFPYVGLKDTLEGKS